MIHCHTAQVSPAQPNLEHIIFEHCYASFIQVPSVHAVAFMLLWKFPPSRIHSCSWFHVVSEHDVPLHAVAAAQGDCVQMLQRLF